MKTEQFNIRIGKRLLRRFKLRAKKIGISASKLMRLLMIEEVNRKKG